MRKYYLLLLLLHAALVLHAQVSYKTVTDVSYVSPDESDAYRRERCKLDVYYPEGATNCPTIVWFHGGGLEGGHKYIPQEFKEKGFAVVAVNYRLSPRAKNPSYTEDAARQWHGYFSTLKSMVATKNASLFQVIRLVDTYVDAGSG
jgi:acetyl esterase/lipase